MNERWVEVFKATLDQGYKGAYVNFINDEGADRVRDAYPPATWDRLAEIKRRYDPTNLFHRNQNVPPAAAVPEDGPRGPRWLRNGHHWVMTTTPAPEPLRDLVIRDVAVLDCTGRSLPAGTTSRSATGRSRRSGRPARRARRGEVREVDGTGTTLMPGLTDAHVHFALIGEGRPRRRAADRPRPEGRGLHRGRAGRGLHDGPRRRRPRAGLGEGRREGPPERSPDPALRIRAQPDRRPRRRPVVAHAAATRNRPSRPDRAPRHRRRRRRGPKAVREQLRRGATQIKLLASGGIASPTDPFDSIQFSAGEIAAATEVAAGWHTYVLAHCHTSPAIDIAIANGVRSIEHGSLLEEATAKRMKELGVFMVPTLQTIEEARRASRLVEPPAREGRPPQGGPGRSREERPSWPTRSASRWRPARTSSGRGRAGGARRS